jgi:hypothetical protein
VDLRSTDGPRPKKDGNNGRIGECAGHPVSALSAETVAPRATETTEWTQRWLRSSVITAMERWPNGCLVPGLETPDGVRR